MYRFKAVNDTLGHYTGDLLIQEVGNRLRRFINEEQQVYRLGGDEFLIIIKHGNMKRAVQLAKHILFAVNQVCDIDDNELYVTGAIGISVGQIDADDRLFLLKTANQAMHRAKKLGKNQFCVHQAEMSLQDSQDIH